jgi:hypothetical protein
VQAKNLRKNSQPASRTAARSGIQREGLIGLGVPRHIRPISAGALPLVSVRFPGTTLLDGVTGECRILESYR